MTRGLPIPLLAALLCVSGSAQEPAPPASPEAALRATAQQFYQLLLEKKYRQAEAMIADDTKDDYYNARKQDIKGFTIEKIEMEKDNAHAKISMKLRVLFLMPGAGAQALDLSPPSYWKIEKGEWRWYIPAELRNASPFGTMHTGDSSGGTSTKGQAPGTIDNPDINALFGQVSIDKKVAELSADAPDVLVTIRNGTPGPIELQMDPHVAAIRGITVKLDAVHLNKGETTGVHIHYLGSGRVSDVVEITAAPLNLPLTVNVRTR